MTIEPVVEIPNPPVVPADIPILQKEVTILEDLYTLGYTRSSDIKVYEDSRGVEIVVQFRTLTTTELRDLSELISVYRSIGAQVLTEKVETLARALIHINKFPLVLDVKDKDDFEKKYSRQPTPLEMARTILYEKIRSPYVIDVLYEEYQKFTSKIEASFADVKKKLNSLPS